MEVLRIFGFWDQEIGSWFTNHEPTIPTIILGVCSQAHPTPKVPKIRKLHIFAISPENYGGGGGGGEVDFLLANKHGSFLQTDSITFGLLIQACPKYLKQKSYNIFVISQGKCEGWTWSLPTDKRQRLLQIAVIILGVCGQA